eukprot:1383579-Rhodomonas_salina.1
MCIRDREKGFGIQKVEDFVDVESYAPLPLQTTDISSPLLLQLASRNPTSTLTPRFFLHLPLHSLRAVLMRMLLA